MTAAPLPLADPARRGEATSRGQARLRQVGLALRRGARDPSTLAGALLVALLVVVALAAPLLATHDPTAPDLSARLAPPSAAHWLGTDGLGRDLYSRLVYGARPTLLIVVLVIALSAPFGVAVGLVAGYYGGWPETLLMRLTDVVMAFPRLILALALVAVLKPGLVNAVIAIAVTAWPPYARLARAETLALRRAEFVEAARGLGMPAGAIIAEQILPQCLASVAIRATLDMAGIILTAAGLGFLGLGAQPPLAEWGAMIAAGRDQVFDAWWVAAVPGLAIVAVSLGFNLLGDGLRDVLDPKHGAEPVAPLLDVEGLTVSFPSPEGPLAVVRDFALTMGPEKVGIVGESGSGKSVTARALLGLVRPPGQVAARRMALKGADLLSLDPAGWRRVRGRDAGMILQDPKFSLNPVRRVGWQVEETMRLHGRLGRAERRARALAMLRAVGIEEPERVHRAYPHELSGGMGQRAMIAAMLVASPSLIIADEPTSALDVIVREQVLRVLDDLVRARGLGLILISHDLPMVARFCDRVLVMYRGRVVESLDARRLGEARHPYTRGLLACLPSAGTRGRPLATLDRDPAWETA